MDLRHLSPEELDVLLALQGELSFFSENCLRIITKQGELIPFKFNDAQWYIHKACEEQKRRTGKVRKIIIKARQMGCTTYVQARYFHKTLWTPHQAAYILAHQAESTLKIYSMASRFHTNLPSALKFPLIKDTEKAMTIENGSSYTVGTAGSSQVGRGMTVQLFHSSETAFYENTTELSTGLMQTVADLPGTEMILESTANGPGNFFHRKVLEAIAGKGEFELIFVPWYWMEEYSAAPLTIGELTENEEKLYEAHHSDPVHGMTLGNLAWRRIKVKSFDAATDEEKELMFQQEYPATPEESFINAVGRFFDIKGLYQAKARKTKEDHTYPLVIGVDQGRTGDDTIISRRRGPVILPFEVIPADDGKERDMRLAGRLGQILNKEQPDMMFVDVTNEHGAVDRLHELGHRKNVKGVHFGERAIDRKRYNNIRSEMHFSFREWLRDPEAKVPDDQQFFSECGSIPTEKLTSNSLQCIESKDNIKSILGWSPNKLDATILTFAYPVKKRKVTTDQSIPTSSGTGTRQAQTGFKSKLSSTKGVRKWGSN